MPLGLTLQMRTLCLAPELASQEDLGGPQEASRMGSHADALSSWRGCLCGDEEGGVQGLRKPVSRDRPGEAGPSAWGCSGSQAHLVCIRFIRLIANKGIRANLLI